MMNNKTNLIWIAAIIIVAVGAFFFGKGMSNTDGSASLYKAVGAKPAETPSTWSYCGSNGNGGGYYLSTSGTCWEANSAGASAAPGGLCGGCNAISTGNTGGTVKVKTGTTSTSTVSR